MSDVRKIFYWLKVHNFQGESQSQVCRNETIKSGEFKRMRHILGFFTVVREEGHHFNGLFCAFLTKAEQN